MFRVILAALLFLATACSEQRLPADRPTLERFPEVSLSGLMDGKTVSLSSYGGQAVLVNFWATWCEPCRKEMASLEALGRIAPDRLTIVGINVDDDVNLAREFVLQQALSFANYSDADMRITRELLRIRALPETIIVAPRGEVAARVTGPRDWASDDSLSMLRTALAPYLPSPAW